VTRLNKGSRLVTQPMATEKTPTGLTHESAPGFERDARTELFLRATTVFAGEGQFYEDAKTADARAVELIRQLAVTDWAWVAGFLPWLRSAGNIRTSSLMLAVEAAKARAGAGIHGGKPLTTRQVVDAVLQRGDEPTEMVQYYLRTYGKSPSGAIARGISDAMTRLWGERAVIRYDKPDRPMRFADAIELAHPRPKTAGLENDWQSALFKHLLDERHHEVQEVSPLLRGITARKALSGLSPKERHALAAIALDHPGSDPAWMIRRAAAGQWEWVISWLGEGAKAAKDWSPLTERQRWGLVIPQMGYMALIRNLRNFEQAGVGKSLVSKICDRIADPKQVAESRQFPYRFLSAHLNTKGAQWLGALEQATSYSTGNIPSLDGMTHVLVDCSGSMDWLTETDKKRRSKLLIAGETPPEYPTRAQIALLFAFALAARNPGKTEIFLFALQGYGPIHVQQGASILRAVSEAQQIGHRLGGGTQLEQNLRLTFDPGKHTRSVILTDEQAFPHGRADAAWMIPEKTPLYVWDVAGYQRGAVSYGPNKVGLGGLTDASFTLMQRYESSKTGLWPWQITPPVTPDRDDEDDDS
jgi:hypothetical protein